jgi:acetyl/propionyl-CoA carboxylase alpha subunit
VPLRLRIEEREVEAELIARRPQLRLRIGDVHCRIESPHLGREEFELTVDGVRHRGYWCARGDGVQVRLNGRTWCVQFLRAGAGGGAAAPEAELRASMPGVVVAVHCAPGQAIAAGDALLTLESMKLQMTLVAAHAGAVREVHVAPQALFERGALLVSFAPPPEPDA